MARYTAFAVFTLVAFAAIAGELEALASPGSIVAIHAITQIQIIYMHPCIWFLLLE